LEKQEERPPATDRPPQRLLSLDALRGLAMFWLIGGREFVLGVAGFVHPGLFDLLETQLTHRKWHGCVAWDLIMPVFLFAVGAAMPFSLGSRGDWKKPPRATYLRIARRVSLLWLFGILYQQFHHGPAPLELFSNALQAIAVGYLVASLALLHLPMVGRLLLLAALLVAYDALLTYVPFGGNAAGTLEKTTNLARYVDQWVLGGFRKNHAFAWIVPGLGFSAMVLLGTTAGQVMKVGRSAARRMGLMTAIGLACLAAGWFWSYRLPFNRYLWTSSLVLWAGGWGFLLWAALHFAIDVQGYKRWAFPLLVIGSNALLAYIIDPLVYRSSVALGAMFLPADPEHYVMLFGSILELTFIWLILWLLYHRSKYFRV